MYSENDLGEDDITVKIEQGLEEESSVIKKKWFRFKCYYSNKRWKPLQRAKEKHFFRANEPAH